MVRCRICLGSDFEDVVDLGETPFADAFLTAEQLTQSEIRMPLHVVVCRDCQLVQLTLTAPRELLYQGDYPYVSSTTTMGVNHYHQMARDIVGRFNLTRGSLAVDIGSNVGVLASGFQRLGLDVQGVEPASKIAEMANISGIPTLNDFFSTEVAENIADQLGLAAVITGTNVVAHIDDLHDLMDGVRTLLAPKGVFVFEAPYLGRLLEQCAYDTIYHEHLSYLAIRPVQFLCERYGLEVFDVEEQVIHGGTLRYFIATKGAYPVSTLVRRMLVVEDKAHQSHLRAFAGQVARHKEALVNLLGDLKTQGASICAVSAPAKGMTLLNYCGIGCETLDFATEKAPLKIGKFTPGGHIPIVPDEELLTRQPDFALLLAWNFADEIMANLTGYRGQFIVPVPVPSVVLRTVAVAR